MPPRRDGDDMDVDNAPTQPHNDNEEEFAEEYVDPDRTKMEDADAVVDVKPDHAIGVYLEIVHSEGDEDGNLRKPQEMCLFRLCKLYAKLQRGDGLIKLLSDLRPRFADLPRAKTAKIVRTVLDNLGFVANTETQQIALCEEYIQWCIDERRAFLRQRIQTKLATLFLKQGHYQKALGMLAVLQTEVKKLDDKQLLVEIFLTESFVHHALRNLPKAKASLTAARSAANSIYVGPQLQAEIDMQGGKLNADERDYRTSYSYFFEAFEGFVTLQDPRAIIALKYMLMSKIMNSQGDEVPQILNSKKAIKFSGPDIDFMRAVAKAYKERSLRMFEEATEKFKAQLAGDKLLQRHLKLLQAGLLEKNLCRIIEPFSKVEIAQVAKLIDMPVAQVETKLSQMILDKKFKGILDQGAGQLIVFDEEPEEKTYDTSLELVTNMGNVVDSLFRRASHLAP